MTSFAKISLGELEVLRQALQKRYDAFLDEKLSLDMTRGKPAKEQLDLSNGMLDLPRADSIKSTSGEDCRNYGGLDGIIEAKKLFAEYLDVSLEEILIGGNASLHLMHDTIVRALLYGVPDGDRPWSQCGPIKFLCPAPGYDRHFAICEHLKIEMIPITMHDDGPDMDQVEELAAKDPAIKGIWVVPKYSNPTGITYSDRVVDRLVKMKTAARDFRIFCDNAYAVHDLYENDSAPLKNFITACRDAGNPNRVYMFGSTSKISFAGAGIAVMAASRQNIADTKQHMSVQTIGPDKVNMLRHTQFFGSIDGIKSHMRKHAAIMRPKFTAVVTILSNELEGKGIAMWNNPRGGYFINLETMEGCASATVAMADKAGVKLTKAGAAFPYGKDPKDTNIRIAPSLPSLPEIKKAMEIVAICIQLVAVQKILKTK